MALIISALLVALLTLSGAAFAEGLPQQDGGQADLRDLASRARAGAAAAHDKLGQAYENGTGVPAGLAAAARWYGVAADAGGPGGEVNLAWSFENGAGLPQDILTARRYWQDAFDWGDETAGDDLAASRDIAKTAQEQANRRFQPRAVWRDSAWCVAGTPSNSCIPWIPSR